MARRNVAVAQEGSIAAAAERRKIAASAVNRRLQELEAEMDTPLVQPHACGMTLTRAARRCCRMAPAFSA